jgi:plastocyanin
MRALVPLIVIVALACVASAASAQQTSTTTVAITSTGFNPQEVTIRPGDTVTWKNTDTVAHRVVSDTGTFRSQSIQPGGEFSARFPVDSSYSYHDASKTSVTGVVNVLSSNVSVGVTRIRVVYGNPVRIFGSIPSGASGETVTLHIGLYGGRTIERNVVTDEGTYEYTYRPKIRTSVYATWNGTTSRRTPFIGVRPLVIFSPLNLSRNRFFVRVKPADEFARNFVHISRQNHHGVWKTTTIVRLNRFGFKRFTGKFGYGTTKAQALVRRHPGYAPGFSVIKLITR